MILLSFSWNPIPKDILICICVRVPLNQRSQSFPKGFDTLFNGKLEKLETPNLKEDPRLHDVIMHEINQSHSIPSPLYSSNKYSLGASIKPRGFSSIFTSLLTILHSDVKHPTVLTVALRRSTVNFTPYSNWGGIQTRQMEPSISWSAGILRSTNDWRSRAQCRMYRYRNPYPKKRTYKLHVSWEFPRSSLFPSTAVGWISVTMWKDQINKRRVDVMKQFLTQSVYCLSEEGRGASHSFFSASKFYIGFSSDRLLKRLEVRIHKAIQRSVPERFHTITIWLRFAITCLKLPPPFSHLFPKALERTFINQFTKQSSQVHDVLIFPRCRSCGILWCQTCNNKSVSKVQRTLKINPWLMHSYIAI